MVRFVEGEDLKKIDWSRYPVLDDFYCAFYRVDPFDGCEMFCYVDRDGAFWYLHDCYGLSGSCTYMGDTLQDLLSSAAYVECHLSNDDIGEILDRIVPGASAAIRRGVPVDDVLAGW